MYLSGRGEYKEKVPHLKCVLIGGTGVGKTSLVNCLTRAEVSERHTPTVGATFTEMALCGARLHLWDTAGQERYQSMVCTYFRQVHIAIVVFDLSDVATYTNTSMWIQKLLTYSPEARVIVVGNKSDKGSNVMAKESVLSAGYRYAETSALSGSGILDLGHELSSSVHECLSETNYFLFSEPIDALTAPKRRGCC